MNYPDKGQEREQAVHRQHLRMLYSLGDFRLASSAAAFLAECDPDKEYSQVELRRFRCFETTAIISYTRPFSHSKGSVGSLSLKMTDAVLTDAQKVLHDSLMEIRNKVIAHSDYEMMRMAAKALSMKLRGEFEVHLPHVVFDEGISLLGEKLFRFQNLIAVVNGSLLEKLILQAQADHTRFDVRRDYLHDL